MKKIIGLLLISLFVIGIASQSMALRLIKPLSGCVDKANMELLDNVINPIPTLGKAPNYTLTRRSHIRIPKF